jgi:transposase
MRPLIAKQWAHMTTATILSGPERRWRWSAAEKVRIVEERLAPESRVTEVARRHDVHPNLLHLWRRQARTGALSVAADDAGRFVPVAIATGNGAAAVTADGDVACRYI